MKKFIKWSNMMTEFNDLDEEGQASVKVALACGCTIGAAIMLCPAACLVTLIIYAVTTQ